LQYQKEYITPSAQAEYLEKTGGVKDLLKIRL
jgi:hypothetical protein